MDFFYYGMRAKVELERLDAGLRAITPPERRAEVKAEVDRLSSTTRMSVAEAISQVYERMKLTGSPYPN